MRDRVSCMGVMHVLEREEGEMTGEHAVERETCRRMVSVGEDGCVSVWVRLEW